MLYSLRLLVYGLLNETGGHGGPLAPEQPLIYTLGGQDGAIANAARRLGHAGRFFAIQLLPNRGKIADEY
jgi:hypothetical protein